MDTVNEAVVTSVNRAGKYLTFMLAKESYGLEILKVREIIGLMDITAVPRTPRPRRWNMSDCSMKPSP